MKNKNIIKFVGLLGVGSFVMLAAASCTQRVSQVTKSSSTNTNQNSSSNSRNMSGETPNENATSKSGAGMNNPSSGGAKANDPAQQLASARQALNNLLDTENNNVNLYSDYAQIQNALKTAYKTTKDASENTNASLDEVKSLQTALQAAIDKAATDKKAFDNNNQALVTAYNELKVTLQSKATTLDGLSEDKYSAIKNKLISLFDVGTGIIDQKLDSISRTTSLAADNVSKANKDIKDALSALDGWKTNADALATSYVKQALVKTQLTGVTNNMDQPGNYSFVGYSVDVTSGSNMTPNWSFAQRKAWTSNDNILNTDKPVTDVSWIYGLVGTDAKYTLTFNYYGPSTGYLYFPYKLVKSGDSGNVALQYKLNDAPEATAITFDEGDTYNGKTPSVSDINVAKITLTDLKFGANKIEFSLPTGDPAKVAPMIGNMYLTSNSDNANKISNSIFGNDVTSDNSVTVNLLNGYSLGTNYSMLFYQLSNYTVNDAMPTSEPAYLVGFIGGAQIRNVSPTPSNNNTSPAQDNDSRTLTIYVNVPKTGEYSIHSTYIYSAGSSDTTTTRSIKFSTDSSNDSNAVSITVKSLGSWSKLGQIDTSSSETSGITTGSKRTLNLQQGLNKVIVSQVSGDTPYIGNLTFTLSDTPQENANPSTTVASTMPESR
ncbi:hypothetical protein H3143_02930 [Mycoplasma tullyi]|uniref:Haemagglutinin Mycoplasma domain-containing protein n=1 Tax=Mycoplasma tullyi TaxID=1612150 RepID=A0A7D7U2T8_9MOLU|nr:hypothetical protein [Mycoplasma tullyi]QMT98429.1 hypothetical protein H3143_02930 [Mycoplasma tullyi]